MDRRTKICIWIILLGLLNFLLFTITYVIIGGEAVFGSVRIVDGVCRYYLHQDNMEVPRWRFIYSGIHSISVWITVMAVMLAMLTLAKDRIVDSMRSSIIRGRTFITILAMIIVVLTMTITVFFIIKFANRLGNPETVVTSGLSHLNFHENTKIGCHGHACVTVRQRNQSNTQEKRILASKTQENKLFLRGTFKPRRCRCGLWVFMERVLCFHPHPQSHKQQKRGFEGATQLLRRCTTALFATQDVA